VQTEEATVNDNYSLPEIHERLSKSELLPDKHLVDAGYIEASNLVESRRVYDIDLIGPAQSNGRWQQVQGNGFDISNFQVDWDREKVICPAGRESSSWKPMVDGRGNDFIHVQFARSDCSICPHLSQCTSAKGRRRTVNFKPRELYEALQQTRLRENAEEFKEEYRNRAGIEGTISQGVRAFGLRRSRYMGKSKTRLQHLATAAAINLERVSDWLVGIGREQTRRSAFARVMQPLIA
jgi:transposase